MKKIIDFIKKVFCIIFRIKQVAEVIEDKIEENENENKDDREGML